MVVGGSRGIGAAVVASFAAASATVRFTYAGSRDAAEALAESTGSIAIQATAADRELLLASVREAGALDVFVYNAGLLGGGDPLTLDPDAVDRLIDVNMRGAYHASVEAARSMADGGRIIAIGSVHGDRTPLPGIAA